MNVKSALCKKEVYSLYKSAFPKQERFPFLLLSLFSLKKNVSFVAFYEQKRFCGFLYGAENSNFFFLLFLATSTKSKGYGSQILNFLKEKKKTIILNIEPINQGTNIEQRKKRYEFYQRNGFEYTGYFFDEKKEEYMILSNDISSFDPKAYSKFLKGVTLSKRSLQS